MAVPRFLRGLPLLALAGLTLVAGVPQPVARAQEPTGADASAFGLPAEQAIEAATALTVIDAPPDIPREIDLQPVAEAAFAQAGAMLESEWSVPALAAALDYDPARAFAFVRDAIGFDPYAGVLRGPEGTLVARAGNATDRALLLSALLDAMLIPHRFAFAELDDATAAAVLARSFVAPAVRLNSPGLEIAPMFDPTRLLGRATRDYALLRTALGSAIDGSGGTASGGTGEADSLAAVRSHVWVQAAIGTGWLDLDPTLPDAAEGSRLVVAGSTAAALPLEAYQTVSLRLTVEQLETSALVEHEVLTHVFDPLRDVGGEIFLYFEPQFDGLGGAIQAALSGQTPWIPVLMIDGVAERGQPFTFAGRGTDLFGEALDNPELTGIRLSIERGRPGSAPERAVRVLLDRVPAELRDGPVEPVQLEPMPEDVGGPLVLGAVHHLMLSTGGANSRTYAALRGLVADFADAALLGEEDPAYSFADVLWPLAVSDEALVLASERGVVPALADEPGWRSFVAAPRVYVVSFGPAPGPSGRLQVETDLLLDGVVVLAPDGADPGATRLRQVWYGALQTALESEFVRMRAGAFDPAGLEIGGPSFSMDEPLTVLSQPMATGLPPGTAGSLARAVAAGVLAVVPGDPAVAKVWWTVDPATGVTRSIVDPGLASGYDFGNGAGSKGANRPPGGNRPSGPSDAGQYSPARHNKLPNGCRPGQEYVALVGCVSVPAAQAIRASVYSAVGVVVSIATAVLASR